MHISQKIKPIKGLDTGDAYIRYNFFGDRTHYLEIVKSSIFTIDLIEYIQDWVKSYENGIWRIFIPTYVGEDDESIVVYSNKVRLSKKLEDQYSLKESIDFLRSRINR